MLICASLALTPVNCMGTLQWREQGAREFGAGSIRLETRGRFAPGEPIELRLTAQGTQPTDTRLHFGVPHDMVWESVERTGGANRTAHLHATYPAASRATVQVMGEAGGQPAKADWDLRNRPPGPERRTD